MKLPTLSLVASLLLAASIAQAQVIVPGESAPLLGVQNADNVKITGGTLDGTAIGGTTPAAGSFTTLSTSGTPGQAQFAPLYGGGSAPANASLQAPTVASAVNQVVVSGAATGSAPSLAVGGTGADANQNLNLKGNGTGIVTLGQAICTVTGASPQTCNGQRGIVTSGTLTTAALTDASFTINNSSVTAASLVACADQGYSGTIITNGIPLLTSCVPGAGSITVHITNLHSANALNGTVKLGFAVLN
ncbi:MAG: hypothetical protein WDO24_23490 [Pseudomonadota bacterium]